MILIVIIIIIILLIYISYRYKPNINKQYGKVVGYQYSDLTDNILNDIIHRKQTGKQNKIIDPFIAGDIYRFNLATNRNNNEDIMNAADYYNEAIDDIYNDYNNYEFDQDDPDPELIIYRVEDFYNDNYNIFPVTPDFRDTRQKVRDYKVKKNKIKNKKTKNRLKEYYTNKPVYNDPQNVHDPNVSNDIKKLYDKIVKSNLRNFYRYDLNSLQQELNNHNFTFDNRDRAQKILNKTKERAWITKLNTTEDNVLSEVWNRINAPENKDNYSGLKSALFDSLANCMDKDHNDVYREVCCVGRCSRYLNSLTLLDKDPKISEPVKTTGILKNEIMYKVPKIIQDEVKLNPDIGQKYMNGEDSDKVRNFEDNLRKIIKEKIEKDYPDTDRNILNNIIEDAQAGV